jgi:anaerobic magnesium-protoporphyrin IX monomethyl ester cyclase
MKVLFTHSYFLQFDPKQVYHAQPYAPLGTMIAAAFVREKQHQVKLFDTMFATTPEAIKPTLDEFHPHVLVIYDDGFNYLTKMCLSNMRSAAFRMQKLAKEKGCYVIVTSSDATDHAEKYLEEGADVVITGEAEHTLIEVLEKIQRGKSELSQLKGLVFKNENKLVRTGTRAVTKTPDEFPLPAWDLIDIAPYKKVWIERHGYFSINVATTRGCPYKCNWCAKPIYGNAYHMRSPGKVIEELLILKERFSFDHVWFCDDIFGLKRSWVKEFADLVRSKGIHFAFKIQSRADLLVQERYVEDLAASGCAEVWMGAESGSQKILDAMDKGTTVEQIRQARQLLKRHGIRASFFLQFGYLGENDADIQSTIELVKETLPDDIGISVSYPLPGTVFYDRVRDQLGEKTNWKHSDELALMFRNTYPPAFYKTLHRLVHSIYRRTMAAQRFRHNTSLVKKVAAVGSFIKHSIKGQWHQASLNRSKKYVSG